MTARRRLWPAGVALACLSGAAFADGGTADRDVGRLAYVLHCGGCHGVTGASGTRHVPVLRDRVGVFLATPEGRRYIPRLPNIAFARIADDAALAALVNYVMFDLAGSSSPPGARRYTAEEVGMLRRRPLTLPTLRRHRDRITAAAIRRTASRTSAILRQ